MIIINPYRFATGSVYDSDFLTWESYLSTPLSAGNRIIFNQFFKDLKGTGNVGSFNNFAELDRLWIHASENKQGARISLVNPSSTAITEVNSPTWTQYQGYNGDGVTSYLNSNFTPSTNGIKFLQNSASFFSYVRTNTVGAYAEIGAISGSNKSFLLSRYIGDATFYPLNFDTGISSPAQSNSDSRGFFVVTRNSSTSKLYKNGTQISLDTNTSQTVNNIPFTLLAINDGVSPFWQSPRQISITGFGSGALDISSFNSAISALATSLGFNV